MRKKSFIYLTIGAITASGVSCGRAENSVQEVAVREVAAESQNEDTRYFGEDLYLTSSGEKLPINAIRAELLALASLKIFDRLLKGQMRSPSANL